MYICAIEDERMKYDRIDFWDNVYGFNMRALKEVALTEPAVDVVDSKVCSFLAETRSRCVALKCIFLKSVVTNATPILNIDLQSCTEKDLSFTSDFRLRATRRDNVHAFVAYFECGFTRLPQPLGFSTSPFAKYTHWKQTIFYLKDPIQMDEGEELTGRIICRPNPHNERDLDITLIINFDGLHSKLIDHSIEYKLR